MWTVQKLLHWGRESANKNVFDTINDLCFWRKMWRLWRFMLNSILLTFVSVSVFVFIFHCIPISVEKDVAIVKICVNSVLLVASLIGLYAAAMSPTLFIFILFFLHSLWTLFSLFSWSSSFIIYHCHWSSSLVIVIDQHDWSASLMSTTGKACLLLPYIILEFLQLLAFGASIILTVGQHEDDGDGDTVVIAVLPTRTMPTLCRWWWWRCTAPAMWRSRPPSRSGWSGWWSWWSSSTSGSVPSRFTRAWRRYRTWARIRARWQWCWLWCWCWWYFSIISHYQRGDPESLLKI